MCTVAVYSTRAAHRFSAIIIINQTPNNYLVLFNNNNATLTTCIMCINRFTVYADVSAQRFLAFFSIPPLSPFFLHHYQCQPKS